MFMKCLMRLISFYKEIYLNKNAGKIISVLIIVSFLEGAFCNVTSPFPPLTAMSNKSAMQVTYRILFAGVIANIISLIK